MYNAVIKKETCPWFNVRQKLIVYFITQQERVNLISYVYFGCLFCIKSSTL